MWCLSLEQINTTKENEQNDIRNADAILLRGLVNLSAVGASAHTLFKVVACER